MITTIHSILFAVLVHLGGFAAQPATAADDYRQGVKALAANNYQEALSHFESAVAAEPDNAVYANDYRKAVIQSKEYDRALDFFEKVVTAHPDSANLRLNYGFAYVDKIPVAGAITQVILADRALTQFSIGWTGAAGARSGSAKRASFAVPRCEMHRFPESSSRLT